MASWMMAQETDSLPYGSARKKVSWAMPEVRPKAIPSPTVGQAMASRLRVQASSSNKAPDTKEIALTQSTS